MKTKYGDYFGFRGEPFSSDIPVAKLLKLPSMVGVKERMDFCLQTGGILLVTGEVGSGKSTSLRWSLSQYHPSEVIVLNITASSSSVIDFYRDLCGVWDLPLKGISRTILIRRFRGLLTDVVNGKKQKVIIVIDEANLLRDEVLSEIHTLSQSQNDSQSLFALVFAGQLGLMDKLMSPRFRPLSSRVVGRSHLEAITRDQMEEYLLHHLKIVAGKRQYFSPAAIMAIHQGSGGFLRKANFLARGGLMAAANEQKETVEAEHIRIAATELI